MSDNIRDQSGQDILNRMFAECRGLDTRWESDSFWLPAAGMLAQFLADHAPDAPAAETQCIVAIGARMLMLSAQEGAERSRKASEAKARKAVPDAS